MNSKNRQMYIYAVQQHWEYEYGMLYMSWIKGFLWQFNVLMRQTSRKKPSLYSSSTEKNLKWVTYTGNLICMQSCNVRQ